MLLTVARDSLTQAVRLTVLPICSVPLDVEDKGLLDNVVPQVSQ